MSKLKFRLSDLTFTAENGKVKSWLIIGTLTLVLARLFFHLMEKEGVLEWWFHLIQF